MEGALASFYREHLATTVATSIQYRLAGLTPAEYAATWTSTNQPALS
jgi:hypothetical protein